MRRRFLRNLFFVSLLGTTAFAAPEQDGAAARESFKAAQSQFDAGKFEEALASAGRALELSKSPNARLYVARSLRALGRFDEAYEAMATTLEEATRLAETEKKYVPTRDAAAAELAILSRKVGKLVIALTRLPEGATVELDGKPVASERLGVPIAILPGTVVVKVSGGGVKTVEKSAEIAAGGTETIAVSVENQAAEPAAPPPAQAPEPQPTSSGGSLRTWGFVSAGIGVAGLATFGVAGSIASSKHQQLEDECGGTRCSDAKYADTVDSGKRAQTIANVGLVVGAVGVLAGGALIAFGGPKQEKAQGARLEVTRGGFALGFSGRF